MLEIEAALQLVFEQSHPLPAEERPVLESLGLIAAETISSDIDSPPHDKSIVDGYALRSADINEAGTAFNLLEEVTAGNMPTRHLVPGTTTRIMTGAPIPMGADAVVMVEKSSLAEDGTIRIAEFPVKAGQNIMRRGSSLRTGQVVLARGTLLRPIEMGVLAEVGRSRLQVIPPPRIGVLATGDELAPVDQLPGPAQIRNSNSTLLLGLVEQAGGLPIDLGVAKDSRDSLREKCAAGLECDILVLSGGVSAGALDLVPQVLEELGVRKVFHKINLKPGKPLWFGVKDHEQGTTLVFGLPGNPVSSLVCFELFVRPAVLRFAGKNWLGMAEETLPLGTGYAHPAGRVSFLPAVIETTPHGQRVHPLPWRGSGDLFTLTQANALIHFSGDEHRYEPDERVRVRRL